MLTGHHPDKGDARFALQEVTVYLVPGIWYLLVSTSSPQPLPLQGWRKGPRCH